MCNNYSITLFQMQAYFKKYFGQVTALLQTNGKIYKICIENSAFAVKTPRIPPFLSFSRYGRRASAPDERSTDKHASVRRGEKFGNCAICRIIRPGRVCVRAVSGGMHAPIVCIGPVLVRSDRGITGHSSILSTHYT